MTRPWFASAARALGMDRLDEALSIVRGMFYRTPDQIEVAGELLRLVA